jgi:WD40 repeat protein
LFEYSNEGNKLQKKLLIHKGAIRSIGFDADGRNLFSGGKDKTIKITNVVKCLNDHNGHFMLLRLNVYFQETSQIVSKFVKAHQSSIYKVKPLNENLFASGDEDGTVKLWDNRQKAAEGKFLKILIDRKY